MTFSWQLKIKYDIFPVRRNLFGMLYQHVHISLAKTLSLTKNQIDTSESFKYTGIQSIPSSKQIYFFICIYLMFYHWHCLSFVVWIFSSRPLEGQRHRHLGGISASVEENMFLQYTTVHYPICKSDVFDCNCSSTSHFNTCILWDRFSFSQSRYSRVSILQYMH